MVASFYCIPSPSGLPLASRPRFNRACPPSPAADIPNAKIAGTSISATFTLARSRAVLASHATRKPGNGNAASIRDPVRTNSAAAQDQARRFRGGVAGLLGPSLAGRLPDMARSAGLDSSEIRDVRVRRAAPDSRGQPVKYATNRPFADPEKAARCQRD
jgi:hypothetical protein